jgi:hypothetical protein
MPKESHVRKGLILALALLLGTASFADDTHIHTGAGGVSYFSEGEDPHVSLKTETLEVTINKSDYFVSVDFIFYNDGPEVTYDIGFPVYAYDLSAKEGIYKGTSPLSNFITAVNGQPVPFEKRTDTKEKNVLAWYTKEVTFAAVTTTNVTVNYSAHYGSEGGALGRYLATYYYGSAFSWKGSISKFDIIVRNKSDYMVCLIKNTALRSRPSTIEPVDELTTRVEYSDSKPDRNALIEIQLSFFPSYGMYDDPNTKKNVISKEFVQFCTPFQLSIWRNLIFAANGCVFRSQALASFFTKLPWYKPENPNVDNLLNDVEKTSIANIKEMESLRSAVSHQEGVQ